MLGSGEPGPERLGGWFVADPGQITDEQLLAFLGDNANRRAASSMPALIRSPRWEAGVGFTMTLEVTADRSYRVLPSPELPGQTWTTGTNFVSATGEATFIDELDGAGRFYRVVSP